MQTLSKNDPKSIGPGMLPISLNMMLCNPSPRDFSSFLTQRRETTTEGMLARKVMKMARNCIRIKSIK